jgi:Ca-activated chloride channel family protein
MRLATIALALGLAIPAPASACGVELVLAMDVSRSVINDEYDLQMGGLANALRSKEVVEAIGWIPGGVMATVTQWSGELDQAQTIGWRHLTDPSSVLSFAKEVDFNRRQFFQSYTAIGEALWHANTLSASNPKKCRRRVIDVSGDGSSNRGREPAAIADALAANGVTINALVIRGARPDPAEYYLENVVRGPGAFIEIARTFHDYARAIQQKLLRELTPALASR